MNVPAVKVLLAGPEKCGKSCLLRALSDQGMPDTYETTVGVDFASREVTTLDGTAVKLQVWDTAGNERFYSVIKMYFRGAHCALFCYAVDDAESLQKALAMHDSFLDVLPETSVKLLVGLKTDAGAEVCSAQGRDAANAIDAQHFEVSAFSGAGIGELQAKCATCVPEPAEPSIHISHNVAPK